MNGEVEKFLEKDKSLPFDLSKPPLIRVTVIIFNPHIQYMIFSHHHLILDGWSLDLLFRYFSITFLRIFKRNLFLDIFL